MFFYPTRIDDLLELIFSLNAFDKYYSLFTQLASHGVRVDFLIYI